MYRFKVKGQRVDKGERGEKPGDGDSLTSALPQLDFFL